MERRFTGNIDTTAKYVCCIPNSTRQSLLEEQHNIVYVSLAYKWNQFVVCLVYTPYMLYKNWMGLQICNEFSNVYFYSLLQYSLLQSYMVLNNGNSCYQFTIKLAYFFQRFVRSSLKPWYIWLIVRESSYGDECDGCEDCFISVALSCLVTSITQ